MPDLTRKSSRERLKIRREPYWQRLTEGAYLGFRRGPDTWIGRYRDRDRKQVYQALHGALEYDNAKKAAETWLQQMGSAVRTVRRGTVREALEAYLDHLRQQGRDAAAKTSEQRFKAIVWPDELASIRLHALVRQDMTAWRSRLQVGRQNRSVDRHVRSVVAGLNKAVELGHIGNPLAWKLEKLADDVADGGETAVILTPEHRKALIGAAIPEAALFFRALELTGARPGEVAAAKVSDLDTKQGILILCATGKDARRSCALVPSISSTAWNSSRSRQRASCQMRICSPWQTVDRGSVTTGPTRSGPRSRNTTPRRVAQNACRSMHPPTRSDTHASANCSRSTTSIP